MKHILWPCGTTRTRIPLCRERFRQSDSGSGCSPLLRHFTRFLWQEQPCETLDLPDNGPDPGLLNPNSDAEIGGGFGGSFGVGKKKNRPIPVV